MANVLQPDKVAQIQELADRGASIRHIARELGIDKNTVNYYRKPVVRRKLVFSDGKCRYMRQPDRIAAWGKEIPKGQRLGTTCAVHYCGNPAHFCLKADGSYEWRNYKDIRDRLASLAEDESVDLPDEKTDESNVVKLRCALQSTTPFHFILRTLKSGGVRIIRTGNWYQDKKEWYERFPVEMVRIAAPVYGLQSGAFILGMLWGTSLHESEVPKQTRCSVPACAFPANGNSKGLCHRHFHFFDYSSSMTGRLDMNDLFPKEGEQHSHFHSGWMWELPRSTEQIKMHYRGIIDKGAKVSDEWWKTNVLKVEAQVGNIQYRGAMGHKGWGKKKIRKAQRKRPAGWHGSHPEQKPMAKYGKRESLTDLPVWTPADGFTELEFHSCAIKDKLESIAEAEHYIAAMERSGNWGLVAYKCQHCEAWHIGHDSGVQSEAPEWVVRLEAIDELQESEELQEVFSD